MQSIYWFCLIIGGVFVAISTLGGPGELEFDADADLDFDADLDADLDADADFDADLDADADLDGGADYEVDTDVSLDRKATERARRRQFLKSLGVFTSFKFWTVGGCFFGLTGLVLGWVQPDWPALLVSGLAIAVGTLCGGTLVTLLRTLRNRQADSLIRSTDFAGLMGTVELPFDAQCKGKICLEVRGSTLHLMAMTDDAKSFVPGDKVLVVGEENNRLWVISADAAEVESGG
ncbi:MAG: hypothetical protein AAGF01_26440 [Cyanobacteria bacterium P01_G01_bin.38]